MQENETTRYLCLHKSNGLFLFYYVAKPHKRAEGREVSMARLARRAKAKPQKRTKRREVSMAQLDMKTL